MVWGSPKTVGQLIGQLQTLDPAMETTALLRMPDDFQDGNAVKQVPITISFEKLNGHWLAPYKGDGRKVLAFWAKADHREEADRGELFTAPPAPVVNPEFTGATAAPDFKALAENLVENLVDCGGADEKAVEQFLKWTEKTCRAAMLAAAPEGSN